MLGSWKEFAFFDVTPVRDPSPSDALLFSDPQLLSIVPSTNGTVLMLTRQGYVKEFTEDMQLRHTFSIFDSHENRVPDFVYAVPNTKLVVTASSKLGAALELKVWNLDANVDLHAQTLVHNRTNTFPPSAFVCSPDLSVIVIGFADGSVVAVRGDLLHDRGTKQRQIYTAPTSVTGLHLTEDFSQVFVACLTQIVAVSTTSAKSLVQLDKSKGAALHCTAGNPGSDFVVARDSDVVCYNQYHRGSSFELVFNKREIFLHSNNVFLVIVGSFQPETPGLLTTESTRVIVIDLINHLIAFNQPLGNRGVATIFEAWGRLNVVGSNGIMYVLKEKSWRSQIDLLKQRHLYQVAIEMIRRRVGDESHALEQMLHQDYADFLFEKNDIDASLKQYILAIDLGQTSRAIRRFKDLQHAGALLTYLRALFEQGKATPQHITLQIICYTKIGGDTHELQQFLSEAVEVPGFDFERAISVLTEQNKPEYAELAARVAAKYPDPDRCVQIRLRQLDDVKGALDYIQTVSVADALRILIQNSRLMLNKLPVETTGVLITLFTGKFLTRKANPKDEITQNVLAASSTEVTDAPLLQSYQAFINFLSSASYLGSNIVSAETLEQEVREPSYLPPRPRLIFSSFIGHNNEFVIFLEACLQAAQQFNSPEKDVKDIASTLFETYLRVGSKSRASELLDKHAALLYPVTVLNACASFDYKLTSEQQHLLGKSFTDIFREKLQTSDIDGALSLLDNASFDLTRLAPKLLAQNKEALDHMSEDQFLKVLNNAVSRGGMSHVEVISEIAHSPYLSVGDLRPFLQQFLTSSAERIKRQDKLADSYIAEIDAKRKAKTGDGDVLTVNYGDCAQCDLALELPAVHYACRHSYHETCLPNDTVNCPRCLPEIENAENLQQQADEVLANEQYFFEELKEKRDKQKVIWDFISRGGLSNVI